MRNVTTVLKPIELTVWNPPLKFSGVFDAENPIAPPPQNGRWTLDLPKSIAIIPIAPILGKPNQRLAPAIALQMQRRTKPGILAGIAGIEVGSFANVLAHARTAQKVGYPAIEGRHHEPANFRRLLKSSTIDQHQSRHGLGILKGKIDRRRPTHGSPD
jgi:hypothetical protein